MEGRALSRGPHLVLTPQLSPHLTGGHSRAQTGWVGVCKVASLEMVPGDSSSLHSPGVPCAPSLQRLPRDDHVLSTGIREDKAHCLTLSLTLTVDKELESELTRTWPRGQAGVVLGCRFLTWVMSAASTVRRLQLLTYARRLRRLSGRRMSSKETHCV